MWTKAEDDEANTQWHEKCLELLKPFVAGYYIGESDTVTYPDHRSGIVYRRASGNAFEELRKKYDPDGVFFNYSDGLS